MARRGGDDGPEQAPAAFRDAARGERLQRVMADAGVASRRDCESMIEQGRVEVNGHLITGLPAWVDPSADRIVVDGRPLPPREKHIYLLLNKPTRTLTSARDEPGADRRTVLDLVNHPWKAKLFPVGRLDYDTVGLVLLTNDGELANRLTHPRYGVPKTYRAVVRGRVEPGALDRLSEGIYLANRRDGRSAGAVRTSRVDLSVVHQDTDKTTIDITLYEGRNRQVRRMLAAVDLPVKKLERLAMGPVRLKGVARGAWRELTHAEVQALRRACGMAKGRAAGERGGDPAEASSGAPTPRRSRKKEPGASTTTPRRATKTNASTKTSTEQATRSKPTSKKAPVKKAPVKKAPMKKPSARNASPRASGPRTAGGRGATERGAGGRASTRRSARGNGRGPGRGGGRGSS